MKLADSKCQSVFFFLSADVVLFMCAHARASFSFLKFLRALDLTWLPWRSSLGAGPQDPGAAAWCGPLQAAGPPAAHRPPARHLRLHEVHVEEYTQGGSPVDFSKVAAVRQRKWSVIDVFV